MHNTNFDFSFDFAPRSAEEGEEVKQIIRLFKQHMSAKSKANFGSGLFIASPDIFQLTFKSGSSDHPFLFKFKPTALLGLPINAFAKAAPSKSTGPPELRAKWA